MKNKKTGWKEFFRLTKGKVILTIFLFGLFFVIGFVCQPIYFDFSGIKSTCGEFLESLFFDPVFLAFESPILWLFYFILFYFISSIIVYLYRKLKNK